METYREANRELWGKVIAQDPRAGVILPKGGTVTIRVAQGAIQMPFVTGLSVAEARKALEDKGFKMGIGYRDTNLDNRVERVMEQAPNGFTQAKWGDPINVILGRKTGTR